MPQDMAESKPSVIIIGAGICGLLTASILTDKGFKVTLLEARQSLGGRIRIATVGSSEAALGAEFVHGDQPFTKKLIEEAGTAATKVTGKSYTIRHGKLVPSVFDNGHWESLVGKLEKLKAEMSIKQFMDLYFYESRYVALRDDVFKFVEGFDAADIDQINALSLLQEWQSDDTQYRITGGYHHLIQYLEKKVREKGTVISCSDAVTHVTWKFHEVIVRTRNEKVFTAQRLITTIPISLLAGNTISFTPDLEDYWAAARRIGFGGVIKFLFELDQSIWSLHGPSKYRDAHFLFSDAKIPTWWTQNPKDDCLLTGWLAAKDAEAVTGNHSLQYQMAVESLSYLFNIDPRVVNQYITDYRIADWLSDPFSRGAYSYKRVGSGPSKEILRTPVDDTLFFAGEALSGGKAMGTVEAALVSAYEVTRNITVS